jgi:hypothetical protein
MVDWHQLEAHQEQHKKSQSKAVPALKVALLLQPLQPAASARGAAATAFASVCFAAPHRTAPGVACAQ